MLKLLALEASTGPSREGWVHGEQKDNFTCYPAHVSRLGTFNKASRNLSHKQEALWPVSPCRCTAVPPGDRARAPTARKRQLSQWDTTSINKIYFEKSAPEPKIPQMLNQTKAVYDLPE